MVVSKCLHIAVASTFMLMLKVNICFIALSFFILFIFIISIWQTCVCVLLWSLISYLVLCPVNTKRFCSIQVIYIIITWSSSVLVVHEENLHKAFRIIHVVRVNCQYA